MKSSEQEFEETSLSANSNLTEHIAFVNDRGVAVDEEQLVGVLKLNPSNTKVVSLRIKPSSRLETLAVALPLTALRKLRIESRCIRDYGVLTDLSGLRGLSIGVERRKAGIPDLSHSQIEELGMSSTITGEPAIVARMKSLKSVVLRTWPSHTLEALAGLTLRNLEVKASKISESGRLDCRNLAFLTFRGCSQLSSVRGVEAERFDIDTCRKLELRTISGSRISELLLCNMKKIERLGFFANCPNLKKFEVTATRLSPECVLEIAAAKQLTFAGLYGSALPVRELKLLSTLAKQLTVTDGINSFRGGQEVPTER